MPQSTTITAVSSCIQLYPSNKPREEQGHRETQILQQPETHIFCAQSLSTSLPNAIGHKSCHPDLRSCCLWLYRGCSVCGSTLSSSHTLISHGVMQEMLSLPMGNPAHELGPQICKQCYTCSAVLEKQSRKISRACHSYIPEGQCIHRTAAFALCREEPPCCRRGQTAVADREELDGAWMCFLCMKVMSW